MVMSIPNERTNEQEVEKSPAGMRDPIPYLPLGKYKYISTLYQLAVLFDLISRGSENAVTKKNRPTQLFLLYNIKT